MPPRALPRLLLVLAAFGSMGAVCGWGAPLEPLASHCPPGMLDCGPGCVDQGATCCDDSPLGGKSQCPGPSDGGASVSCVPRGAGACLSGGPGRFCCGLLAQSQSTEVSEAVLFDGVPGVFCGTNVVAGGDECCKSVSAKKLCRFTTPRGAGAGGGAGGGGAASCSASGPGWLGSARTCTAAGATCACSTASVNRCITQAEFDSAGLAFPAACRPSGQTGCLEAATGALKAPCCPGLSCRQGAVCGTGSSTGACLQ